VPWAFRRAFSRRQPGVLQSVFKASFLLFLGQKCDSLHNRERYPFRLRTRHLLLPWQHLALFLDLRRSRGGREGRPGR
jgi:hypothetical protein